jgi:hypothetical protein
MTLEEILRAEGYTDADFETAAPMLQDPKLRAALEKRYANLNAENAAYKKENEAWANWHKDEGQPILDLYQKDVVEAKAAVAALRERLRLAEASGFAPKGSVPEEANPAAAPSAFDAKAHKVVTYDDMAFLADKEGDAIAMSHDIAGDYAALTGQNLVNYRYTSTDGRQLYGMRALRQESKDHRFQGELYDFVARKFDFAAKRATAHEKTRQQAEEAIRADERSKMAAKYGNPEMRTLMPSVEPFLPRAASEKIKHPWQRDPQERRRDRLEHLTKVQMTTAPAGGTVQ